MLCSVSLSDAQRDCSIDMETEEEWDALSLNPNQPLITRKVNGWFVFERITCDMQLLILKTKKPAAACPCR